MHERVKMLSSSGLRVLLLFLTSGLGFPAAAQLYWDTNGRTAGASSGTTAPGTWGVDNFWSTDPTGTANTAAWTPAQQAVFSAGGNATGSFTVNVSGTQVTSGILFEDGNVTLSGGRLLLTNGIGNATLSVASTNIATLSSSLLGSSGLVKSGTGTLLLSGTNSYSGLTDLQLGTLLVSKPTSLGSSSLDLDGGTFGATGGPLILNNTVTLSSDSTIGGDSDLTFTGDFNAEGGPRLLTFSNPGTTTFAGANFILGDKNKLGVVTLNVLGGGVAISGVIQNGVGARPDSILKTGNGSLLLSGNNTFSGGIELVAGSLYLGNDNAAGSGNLTLDDGVTLSATNGDRTIANPLVIQGNVTFAGPDSFTFLSDFDLGGDRTFTVWNTTTFSGAISGKKIGSITKLGSGNLILNGNNPNTFIGGVTVGAGTLTAAKVSALGTGPLTINAGTVDLTTFNQSVGTFTLAGGTLTGSGGTLTAPSFQVQSGTIAAPLAGTGPLLKSTAGTVTLSAASTFSGGATLNAGTLRVINTSGSATGSGTLTVNSGATLTGSGSISGPLIVNSGGSVAPGDPLGSLSTANETWNASSHLVVQIKDALSGPGIGWDLLRITGTMTLHTSAANPLYVDLQSLTLSGSSGPVYNFNSSLTYSWKLITTTGGIAFDPGQSVTTALSLNPGSFANSTAAGSFTFTLANGNKDLMLAYTPGPVPEPSALSMVTIGFGILLLQRRIVPRRGD